MKTLLLGIIFCLAAGATGRAQSATGTPSTKEDIEKYLQVVHARESMQTMLQSTVKPLQQAIHDQYEKNQDKLPADFEARMNTVIDEQLKAAPIDQMIDAMLPIYQKYLTRQDLDALTAFYSTTVGQKLLRQMPAVSAESLQAIRPLVQQQMEAVQQAVQKDAAGMVKDSPSKPTN